VLLPFRPLKTFPCSSVKSGICPILRCFEIEQKSSELKPRKEKDLILLFRWMDLSDNPLLPSSFSREFAHFAFPGACVEISLPDEVIAGRLFIGNEGTARNKVGLRGLNVSHVLSVCHFDDKLPFQHLVFPVNDALSTNLRAIFVSSCKNHANYFLN
jgi:hypothetical protein